MVIISDAQLQKAEAEGRRIVDGEPRAERVSYDQATGRIAIDLINGCTYAFPARLVEDLHGARGDDLATVEVDGAGFNLHWPTLDVDLPVPALVAGIFGTKVWMARELARVAGRSTSLKKAASSRVNGMKGGRPRKSAAG